MKVPPVVPKPHAEAAVFTLNWLSATGTGILLAAIVAGLILGYGPRGAVRMYGRDPVPGPLLAAHDRRMLALGYVTSYSGTDATLGLAFANTGWLYPFFGTLLGWLGVALTGSDTASNVLFGSLQKITAQQLGLNPVLMAAANSSGGVMGKMIDAQSIVVACTATNWYGHEGEHPALCLLAQHRAGGAGRRPGYAAGLRGAVHPPGAADTGRRGGTSRVTAEKPA